MRDLPVALADDFSTGYRSAPSLADALRRWVEAVRGERNGAPIDPAIPVAPQQTLGLMTARDRAAVEQLTGPVFGQDLYDYVLDRSAVQHVMNRHTVAAIEAARGQRVVTAEDFGRLGQLLNAPDRILPGESVAGRGPMLRYEKRFDDGMLVAIFELRSGRKRLALATMWVER
jgi:hypothetical protein